MAGVTSTPEHGALCIFIQSAPPPIYLRTYPLESSHAMVFTVVVAMAAGVFLIGIARRVEVSAVALLLFGGVLLGPVGLGWVQPAGLGSGLRTIVSLAVALILFEGGLTLDPRQYRSASSLIRRLLTLGVVVTWVGTAACLWVLFGFDPVFCLLAASLVIVTGPTVIGPLLKRIKVTPRIHGVLHWEGVLIDPVGVFVAILCFDWLVAQDREVVVLSRFVLRFAWGLGLGVIAGLVIDRWIRSRWIPDEMPNVAALGGAVLVFGAAELLFSESGLLAVTVAGLTLGLRQPADLHRIRAFKAEITDLLIGTLFILLSASLDPLRFAAIGLPGLAAVAVVMVVVRPLSVQLCALGLDMNWRERLFLSWVAPRGIVAASMASLFAYDLQARGYAQAAFLETFTYSVIAVTVVVHSLTAGTLAGWLGLRRPEPTGWLIVGAHPLGRAVGRFIAEGLGRRVVLMDTNPAAVAAALAEGLQAHESDARDPGVEELLDEEGLGHLLALTDNEDLNMLLCHRWSGELARSRLFYWASSEAEEGQREGTAVWTRLPKPSVLSGELERGEAVLSQAPIGQAHEDIPLAVIHDGTLLLKPSPRGDGTGGPEIALLLRREADLLANAVHPELVLDTSSGSPETLFRELLELARARAPGLSVEALVAELVARERLLSSGIGHGVAVPHTFTDVPARLCVLARLQGVATFQAPDAEAVRLVLLLISPAGDHEGHLKTLAEVARLLGSRDTRAALLAASDAAGMVAALRHYTP